MLHAPFLAHPLGWLILGIGGYALYQSGRKKGEQENRRSTAPVEPAPAAATKSKGGN